VQRLFQKQSSPWDQATLFSMWQSDLPGIGDAYTVHCDMLLGIAVCIDDDTGPMWQYLPAESLPHDPAACFDALFAVKERWTLRELEPYLQRMIIMAPNVTQSELLLRFTRLASEDHDGASVKLYQRK
jgi:Sister chromatid cohesion protein Dcc1